MNVPIVVGVRPILPGPLRYNPWLNDPIPATRLAAMRIATGIVLLFDILALYWPYRFDYLGPNSLGAANVFADRFDPPTWHWSLFRWLPGDVSPTIVLSAWAIAALCLALGVLPRLSAAAALALAISVRHANPYIHNSGDLIRQFLLFILMLSPCGATWTVTRPTSKQPVLIPPWPICLVIIQLSLTYFMNGIYKLIGPEWRDGTIMFWVLGSATWSRWTNIIPFEFTIVLSWIVLIWELAFPILIVMPWSRTWTLLIGVGFHVISGLNLELGPFPLYALAGYTVFVPWERLPLMLKWRSQPR